MIIDLEEVFPEIPVCFVDNGPSSPFRWFYPVIYPSLFSHTRHIKKTLYKASRAHDWGFWYARLPGSKFECVSKIEWDRAYSNYIISKGHTVVGLAHYTGLRTSISTRIWHKNWKKMMEMGDITLADYFQRKHMEIVGLGKRVEDDFKQP